MEKKLKYDFICMFLWIKVGKPVVKRIARNHNISEKKALKEVKSKFKEVLKRTPDIGKTPFLFMLKWGCLQFSLPQVFEDLTEEEFRMSVREIFTSSKTKNMIKNDPVFSEERMKKFAQSENVHPFDWVRNPDKSYLPKEMRINFTRCGLCNLGKQEHMEKWTPYMCELDYVMMKGSDAELIRTKTLAYGDDCCDFRCINLKYSTAEEVMKKEGIKKSDLK